MRASAAVASAVASAAAASAAAFAWAVSADAASGELADVRAGDAAVGFDNTVVVAVAHAAVKAGVAEGRAPARVVAVFLDAVAVVHLPAYLSECSSLWKVLTAVPWHSRFVSLPLQLSTIFSSRPSILQSQPRAAKHRHEFALVPLRP